jgi:hypothetical protein
MPAQSIATEPFRTSSDLVLKALSNLGVIAAGQTVSPEDFSTVSNQLDSIFRMLGALELVYVADPNNIPGEWFLPLADIVAGVVSTDFGAGPEFVKRGLGAPPLSGLAAMSLKIILRGRPTGEPQRTESF